MGRQSILECFYDNVEHRGGRTAALVKRGGAYKPVTWAEMAHSVRQIAAALLGLGLKPGDRACIISQTRLEWVNVDLGILAAGGVTVPIYPSNLPEECQHIVENSGAVVVFAEDDAQAQKFRAERARLPNLEKVVQISGEVADSDGWVVSLDSLVADVVVDEAVLAERRRAVTRDSILTIIYTSGTTGRPKGVVTTHDNMVYEAEAIQQINVIREQDVELLFLPLAHVFAKVLECVWLHAGHVMAFAESMQTIKENLGEVRPTVMAGVPRIFEKFYGAVVQKGLSAGGVRRVLFERAQTLSDRHGDLESQGQALPIVETLQFAALKKLVFSKIAKGLGDTLGGRMRVLVSGGAPLAPKIAWFFRDAGLDILEGYGLTETSAATCLNRPGRNHIGTVGLPVPGTQVRIADDGELLVRGRGVTKGYWQNEEATAEVFKDGWFSTGDVVRIESSGAVRIVDRKKDLIITAGGKNVAPQNIENLVKTHRLISQVVVHGDKRNYLTALITLDADALKAFAEERSLGGGSYAELTQRPEVLKEVDQAMRTFNRQLASYETIKKFKILEHDFTQDSGELTPSLKVKRKVINQRYKSTLDGFYEEAY
jgi:long-chain acyl-CoA synthetase